MRNVMRIAALLAAMAGIGASPAEAGWECSKTCMPSDGDGSEAWVVRARDIRQHRWVYVALPTEARCREVRTAMLVDRRHFKVSLCRRAG